MDSLAQVFNMAATALPYIGALAVAWMGLRGTLFNNQQNEETLITRFGKHTRTIKDPGLNVKIPFIDKIAARVPVGQQFQAQETLETKTKDDLFVSLPISIQFVIGDTTKYTFQNKDAVENMKKVVSAAVRTATAGKDFQELYGDRDEISNAVVEHVRDTVEEFGLHIRRIIIDQPTAPEAVQKAFNEVRASERLKEAARNNAEAHKIETVTKAQAEKEADLLRGQGKAEFRRAIFDQYSEQINKLVEAGVPREEAVDVMMGAMKQDTLREIGDRGNLVIVTDGQASSGTASRIAELQTLTRTLRPAGEQDNGGSAPKAAPSPM